MQRAAARTGARVVVAPIPFPIAGPDEVVEALLAAVDAADAAARRQPRDESDGARLPDRAARPRVRGARHRHARRRGPRAGDGAGRRRRRSRAAYWAGNGHKWLCGPKGTGFLWVRADRREAIHPLVCRTGRTNPLGRTIALPLGGRLGRDDRSDRLPDTPRGDRLDGAASRRLARAHGREPRTRARRSRPDPARRSASTAPAPDDHARLDGGDARPRRGLRRRGRGPGSVPVRRGHRGVGRAWPVRAARARTDDPPRSVLLRISAAPYNEPADFDRLASVVAGRVGKALTTPGPAGG